MSLPFDPSLVADCIDKRLSQYRLLGLTGPWHVPPCDCDWEEFPGACCGRPTPWENYWSVGTWNTGPEWLQGQVRVKENGEIRVKDVDSPFFDLTIDIYIDCVFEDTFNVPDGGTKTVSLAGYEDKDVTLLVDPIGMGAAASIGLFST